LIADPASRIAHSGPGSSDPASRIPYPASLHFRALPPLSLYIHIPWCARKCPYCDFNSHEARTAVPEERYIAALIADLDRALPGVWGRRVTSVFFGGGTPSLFPARSVDAILSAVRARLALTAGAEITLEANPGTAEAGKFRDFRAAGVNRLSVGIQSFDPRHLKSLGRIHDEREARRAIEIARHDFDNLNLDLMYGLPGQTVAEALSDIEQALVFDPPHLSCYHLTIEPNTYFHRFPPKLPDDDTAAAMQEAIEARLAEAGYDHYEVSAYAKLGGSLIPGLRPRPDALHRIGRSPAQTCAGTSFETPAHPSSVIPARSARCAHNLNYWTFGDYLGIGAGAHSKLSLPGRVVRQVRVKHPERYMESAEGGDPIQAQHEVRPEEVPFEFMMNALRLNAGFAAALFEERAGLPLTAVLRELEDAERRGLIERDPARIAPTLLGRRFLNDLLQLFLREKAAV
jgi:oxygen-independent coproporphyrinogen-3 oxidase